MADKQFGLLTFFTGCFYYYALPDTQLTVGWLTEREKAIAVDRIRGNFQGIGNYSWQWYQVKEAFLDPRTYLYFLFSSFMNIPNGGIGTFGSLIINVSHRVSEPSGPDLFSHLATRDESRCCSTCLLARSIWDASSSS